MWLHMGEQVSTLRKTCRRGGARGIFTVLYFFCEASSCLRFRLPVQQNSGASFLKSFPWILNWYAAIPGHQQLSLNNWTPEEQARGKGLWEREKGRGQYSHGRKKGSSKQRWKGGWRPHRPPQKSRIQVEPPRNPRQEARQCQQCDAACPGEGLLLKTLKSSMFARLVCYKPDGNTVQKSL